MNPLRMKIKNGNIIKGTAFAASFYSYITINMKKEISFSETDPRSCEYNMVLFYPKINWLILLLKLFYQCLSPSSCV